MRRPFLALSHAALALLTAAPGPPTSPAEFVRSGNTAAARGDLDAAGAYYAAAAERAEDPGLVAFNRGVLAMRVGQYRDAELHFLAALDDRAAPAERRRTANYNLGLALLLCGGSTAVYRASIDATLRCLDASSGVDPLQNDAARNLEVAKLMWAEARLRERAAPPPPTPEPPPDPPARPTGENPPDDIVARTPGQGETARDAAGKPAPPHATPRSTDRSAPGRGTLPVLPDADDPPPLSPPDARAHLQRHAARLAKDRAANADLLAGPERPGTRDW